MKEECLREVMDRAMEIGREKIPLGSVASYIPELSKARQDALGLCIALPDGRVFKSGDTNIRFTIQSISKVISFCKALELWGPGGLPACGHGALGRGLQLHCGAGPAGEPTLML